MMQKKVRIAINAEAARRAGFKISAKLLKVGKIIKAAEDAGGRLNGDKDK